eukprot:7936899-Lingulodinium_polyedra.AAC.1
MQLLLLDEVVPRPHHREVPVQRRGVRHRMREQGRAELAEAQRQLGLRDGVPRPSASLEVAHAGAPYGAVAGAVGRVGRPTAHYPAMRRKASGKASRS